MNSDQPKVVVIGAQGALGKVCVEKLRGAGFSVIRAGRRPEPAADFRLMDLDQPASVSEACSGMDLVVTTVRHPRHTAERVVAREGGMLLSVASLWASDRAELKAQEPDAKGLVLLHAGGAPGLYTLILKEWLEAFPEADGMEISLAVSALQASGRGAIVDFAFPVLTAAKRHPTRTLEFRPPIGRRRALHAGGAEVGFFGELAEGRSARVYLAFMERWAQAEMLALNRLGLWQRIPLGAFTFGSDWKARRTTEEPRRDILALTRGGKRLIGAAMEYSGDYQATAAATVSFAEALFKRRAAEPRLCGVLGAEEIFDFSEFRDGLASSGAQLVAL